MKDNLACALQDIPKSVLNTIIQEQMKKSVLKAFEDDGISEQIDEMVIKVFKAEMLKTLQPLVKNYVAKNGKRLVEEAIDNEIDNEGLPDKVYNVIQDVMTEHVINQFKKGNK